ncbi:hypothetical protein DM860_013150 [Cuscuta australis]|uniref:DUF4283 domain-containing protein n=1 Tax=Cuscuta australis TaxID=267555 RepID=A0A328D7V2_9ASTE|nr:hypothetical protein DM860_013150 [Cuscuta australis]
MPATDHGVVPVKSKLFSNLFMDVPSCPRSLEKQMFEGCPSVFFSKAEVEVFSRRFKYAVVGRFRRKPPVSVVKSFLDRLGFAGGFTVGDLSSNSVLINFERDEDYQRFFFRKSWTLGKEVMAASLCKNKAEKNLLNVVLRDKREETIHKINATIGLGPIGAMPIKEGY